MKLTESLLIWQLGITLPKKTYYMLSSNVLPITHEKLTSTSPTYPFAPHIVRFGDFYFILICFVSIFLFLPFYVVDYLLQMITFRLTA